MNVVACEVSTSNSCENTKQLNENDNWEDSYVLKYGVMEDANEKAELHAGKSDSDQIEDDELKDHASKNGAGGNIYEDIEKSFCDDTSKHRGMKLRNVETHHGNIEDSTIEITHKDSLIRSRTKMKNLKRR